MIELIDQSAINTTDPSTPVMLVFRCSKCHGDIRTTTRARAEQHRCGQPLAAEGAGAPTQAAIDAMIAQAVAKGVEQALANMAQPKAKPPRPPAPVPVATPPIAVAPEPKKRGRPRKAAIAS